MTTEKQSDKTTAIPVNDNKTVFGPLGTYAVVAVIMVSIIVTTAIMLNKELNIVEGQVAAVDNKMTEVQTIDANNIYTVVNHQPAEIIVSTSETYAIQETTETAEVETAPAPVNEQIAEIPSAEVLVAIEETAVTTQETEQAQATAVETVVTATLAETRQQQAAKDNQDRIESYKLEQKQRMAEMFARIRLLESQRLDQYKSSQDEQITRLREQVTSQQQMIDELVSRNKELFEMRAANIQRNQTKREQVLNRI